MGILTRDRLDRSRLRRPIVFLWTVVGGVSIAGAYPAQAADWRYCYAYEEASQRFLMSAAFQPAEAMDRVERAWRDYLVREGVQEPRTGCPLGFDRAGLGAIMKNAATFNRGEGNHVVAVDWPAGDPVAAR